MRPQSRIQTKPPARLLELAQSSHPLPTEPPTRLTPVCHKNLANSQIHAMAVQAWQDAHCDHTNMTYI